MKMPLLLLGLPKGSLEESTIRLFAKAGFKISKSSRSYRPTINDEELDGRFVRAQEISRYVEHDRSFPACATQAAGFRQVYQTLLSPPTDATEDAAVVWTLATGVIDSFARAVRFEAVTSTSSRPRNSSWAMTALPVAIRLAMAIELAIIFLFMLASPKANGVRLLKD